MKKRVLTYSLLALGFITSCQQKKEENLTPLQKVVIEDVKQNTPAGWSIETLAYSKPDSAFTDATDTLSPIHTYLGQQIDCMYVQSSDKGDTLYINTYVINDSNEIIKKFVTSNPIIKDGKDWDQQKEKLRAVFQGLDN